MSLASACSPLVNRLTFHPQRLAEDMAVSHPQVEELFLLAADGVRLHALAIAPNDRAGANGSHAAQPSRAILFLHGNAGHVYHRMSDAITLADRTRLSVLLLSYRGYGKSDGRPGETGVYADARGALAWMEREWNLPAGCIVVVGRSLGAAVAVEVARERPVGALVLVSPFTSGRDMARVMGLGWLAPLAGRPFDSLAKAGRISSPTLVIHGDRDEVVPFAHGQTLFEALPHPDKHFVTIRNGGHNNLTTVGGSRYFGAIGDFIDTFPPRSCSASAATLGLRFAGKHQSEPGFDPLPRTDRPCQATGLSPGTRGLE